MAAEDVHDLVISTAERFVDEFDMAVLRRAEDPNTPVQTPFIRLGIEALQATSESARLRLADMHTLYEAGSMFLRRLAANVQHDMATDHNIQGVMMVAQVLDYRRIAFTEHHLGGDANLFASGLHNLLLGRLATLEAIRLSPTEDDYIPEQRHYDQMRLADSRYQEAYKALEASYRPPDLLRQLTRLAVQNAALSEEPARISEWGQRAVRWHGGSKGSPHLSVAIKERVAEILDHTHAYQAIMQAALEQQ